MSRAADSCAGPDVTATTCARPRSSAKNSTPLNHLGFVPRITEAPGRPRRLHAQGSGDGHVEQQRNGILGRCRADRGLEHRGTRRGRDTLCRPCVHETSRIRNSSRESAPRVCRDTRSSRCSVALTQPRADNSSLTSIAACTNAANFAIFSPRCARCLTAATLPPRSQRCLVISSKSTCPTRCSKRASVKIDDGSNVNHSLTMARRSNFGRWAG